jgi:AAA+ superfamily predicted ATPase
MEGPRLLTQEPMMAETAESAVPPVVDDFRKAMEELRELYRSSAVECARAHPDLTQESPRDFVARMLDLHRGLLIKLYAGLFPLDWRGTQIELDMARAFFEHVWGRDLNDDQLKQALEHLLEEEKDLRWNALVGPFERLRPLRNRCGRLQTLVLRIANLIAKCNGRVNAKEVRQLEWIQAELRRHLERLPLDAPGYSDLAHTAGKQAVQKLVAEARDRSDDWELRPGDDPDVPAKSPEEQLDEVLAELDDLIGMDCIKQEVRGLINFLKMQQERKKFDLPHTPISLHSVFSGNPGTGKTTVARLLGRVFGAMGLLTRGHLVETDRSGLVAEYAGQTAPKANKKIDEALDGVLFIDEAYSLIAEKGDDPYGAEAVQTLLKRMEDDRDRLVVILAGYTKPIGRLLRSNPGLSSRFSRNFAFPDYTAPELGQIFHTMARKNQYDLPPLTRAKLLLGFRYLLGHRDEHFGNGRLVRNLFEAAIGKLANRIAGIVPLTRELLTTLQPEDIAVERVPATVWRDLDAEACRFRAVCTGCQNVSLLPVKCLGRNLQCKRCQAQFCVEWADLADADS